MTWLCVVTMLIFSTLIVRGLRTSGLPRVRMSSPGSLFAAASTDATWFGEGLSFGCTQCGACCSGSPGSVRLSKQEITGMSLHLNMEEAAFKDRYCRIETQDDEFSWYELKEIPTPAVEQEDGIIVQSGLDCVFLDRDTMPGKAICSIYEKKPFQCGTWPFWEELVEDKEAWIEASKGPEGCPGLGKGKFYTAEEIIESVEATERYRHELDHEAMDGIDN